jgi:hypothetical protein
MPTKVHDAVEISLPLSISNWCEEDQSETYFKAWLFAGRGGPVAGEGTAPTLLLIRYIDHGFCSSIEQDCRIFSVVNFSSDFLKSVII